LRDKVACVLQKLEGRVVRELPLGAQVQAYANAADMVGSELAGTNPDLARGLQCLPPEQPGGRIRRMGGVDLALLGPQGGELLTCVEVKVMYGFDVLHGGIEGGMHLGISLDVLRMRCAAAAFGLPLSACQVLVFVIDFEPSVNGQVFDWPELSRQVVYAGKQAARLADPGRPHVDHLDEYMQSPAFWSPGVGPGRSQRVLRSYSGGEALGIKASLHAWLLTPLAALG